MGASFVKRMAAWSKSCLNVLLAALAGVEKGSRASAAHGAGVTGAFMGVTADLTDVVVGRGQTSGVFKGLFIQGGVHFFECPW